MSRVKCNIIEQRNVALMDNICQTPISNACSGFIYTKEITLGLGKKIKYHKFLIKIHVKGNTTKLKCEKSWCISLVIQSIFTELSMQNVIQIPFIALRSKDIENLTTQLGRTKDDNRKQLLSFFLLVYYNIITFIISLLNILPCCL